MTMSSGGYVDLSTTWDDIQLQSHHAGSLSTGIEMLQEPVEVSIDIGIGATWNYSLNDDGTLNLFYQLEISKLHLLSHQFSTIEI